jgi:ABC-2 type transport system permease protein
MVRANLRKLVRRPASWVTLGLLVGLNGLILLALLAASQVSTDPAAALGARQVFTFPAAYSLLLGFVMLFGPLFAVAYGGAIAGSEWGWGTLKAAVSRGESRTRYTLAMYAAVAIAIWIGLVVAYLAAILMAIALSAIVGVSLAGVGEVDDAGALVEHFLRAAVALAMTGAFGLAIATVTRSQLAGIVVGVGLSFAEGIAGLFLPEVFKWFPFAAASAATATAGSSFGGDGGPSPVQLDSTTALLVVIAWLVAALVVLAAWTERAEING